MDDQNLFLVNVDIPTLRSREHEQKYQMLLSLTAFFVVNSGLSVIYNFLTKGSKGERFCILYIIELSML